MVGEKGHESSPIPCNINSIIWQTICPLPYYPTAIGAMTTPTTKVQMGVDTPRIEFPGGRANTATGQRASAVLDHHTGRAHTMSRHPFFTCNGTLSGIHGRIHANGRDILWSSDDHRSRPRNGNFISDYRQLVLNGDGRGRFHHVIWAGKNNITTNGGNTVLADVAAMLDFTGGYQQTIILGQWTTQRDANTQIAAMRHVNDTQRDRYGNNFLDIQHLVTTPEGLSSPPVAGLGLWTNATVRREAAAGRAPDVIVASDGIHLNGWGNLIVTWALIEKMKELTWL